ncbi:MAG: nitrate transporter [Rhizobiales bacterium PAR1]|nr:MAG: nitrate transporter [Rhizobiales bacterium PAR1]
MPELRDIQPRETIRIGFMPLLDAAIPVVAARCGFARKYGLEIELVRETSWANVRDRLAIGHFDAAHLLAPLPIAATLGLTPYDVPLVVPMTLGHGGNAITVSETVWQAMVTAMPEVVANDPVTTGQALKQVILVRRQRGEAPLALAVVHPYSSHNYELRYWLAASGIDPDEDVAIAILPPPYMPDALAARRIDGFCVGEPWNSVAAQRSAGRIILTKQAIWPASPDKVLALRADWAEAHGDLVDRLMLALIESALWCAEPAYLEPLVEIMSGPDILGVDAESIRPALSGALVLADGPHVIPGMLDFAGGDANFPWKSHALWYLAQMIRWRQASPAPEAGERAAAVYRPDLYRKAAMHLGLSAPEADFRHEAGSATKPSLGFFDGMTFDPEDLLPGCCIAR